VRRVSHRGYARIVERPARAWWNLPGRLIDWWFVTRRMSPASRRRPQGGQGLPVRVSQKLFAARRAASSAEPRPSLLLTRASETCTCRPTRGREAEPARVTA
jgi:hypothetical protein